MNEITVFNNNMFGEVRTILIDNEPWFCLVDVCRILGIGNPTDVKNRLMKNGVDTIEGIDSLGRKQNTNFINEPNLYKVVFQSRKPEAEQFANWVTSEVLPSIRKHGLYAKDELLSDPDLMISILMDLKKEREEKKRLLEKVEEDKPKVQFAETVTKSKDNILMRDMAKLLCDEGFNVGEKRLYKYLRNNNILMQDNMPYQTYVDRKYFVVKENSVDTIYGIKLTKTTLVTPKGQMWIVSKIKEEMEGK